LKNTAFGGGKLVQVLSTNFLAPKKNIALVEVAGEILVLGVSDQNISLLTSIREPERIEEIKNAHGDNSHGTDWNKVFPRMPQKRLRWLLPMLPTCFLSISSSSPVLGLVNKLLLMLLRKK